MNLSIEENKKYLDDGVLIVSNFLTLDEVRNFRKILDDYFLNHKSFSQGNHGKILSGFAGQTPELEELNLFHHNKRLHRILGSVLSHPRILFSPSIPTCTKISPPVGIVTPRTIFPKKGEMAMSKVCGTMIAISSKHASCCRTIIRMISECLSNLVHIGPNVKPPVHSMQKRNPLI